MDKAKKLKFVFNAVKEALKYSVIHSFLGAEKVKDDLYLRLRSASKMWLFIPQIYPQYFRAYD